MGSAGMKRALLVAVFTVSINQTIAQPPADRSATQPHPPRLAMAPVRSEEKAAGNEFLPPPTMPREPEAIQIYRELAAGGEPLALETLESLACRNNPTLLQAQEQIQGELGKAVQAGLWPNPTMNYIQEQIGVGGTPGEFVGGAVAQRFITGRKLDLSRAKYRVRAQAAQWHALQQQYRVLNDVRVHYYRARGNYELVQIHRELLKSAEDDLLTDRERYNVGQATRAQVHLANVALQRARLDLLREENDYHASFQAMTALVGVDLPLAPLATPLEGDMTPIDWHDALSRLLTEAPQLQVARSKLESDRITMRREIVEPIPDVIVEGGAGYNFEAERTVASARVSVEVPIFDWNQGTIRQAEADYARQQAEVRRTELTLKQELSRVYRNYLTALQFATNYAETILPDARAAYELQLRSYKDSRIPWDEVLRTQAEYYSLRAEYIRHLIAWRESEVLVAGFLLHGGLMAPSAPLPPGHINAVPKPR
jgi:outer membrane protein, heavy metal efflux system